MPDNVAVPTSRSYNVSLLGSTNPPQDIVAAQEFARKRRSSLRCDTALSHTALAGSPPSPSKSAVSARPGCRTSLLPKRRSTGLWQREAVWQYRTRVPADLQAILGRTHINRSLRTSSYPDAIRAARSVTFEIEQEFDTARGDTGSETARAACHGVRWSPLPEQSEQLGSADEGRTR